MTTLGNNWSRALPGHELVEQTGVRYAQSVSPPLTVLNETTLYSFELNTYTSTFGYPRWCPGDQPSITEPEFFPPAFASLDAEDEVKKLCKNINDIFHETGNSFQIWYFMYLFCQLLKVVP